MEKMVDRLGNSIPKVEWDFEGIHYFDGFPLSVQRLLVLDALNFCFLPDDDLAHDHLALGLKEALEKDKSAFDADHLQKYTGPRLGNMLKWPRPLPLEDERIRLLHEVGRELQKSFDGKASNLVESCGKSAAKLVTLVTCHFPGFRDHSVYRGQQVFLYKRAQIFAADLWGEFKGEVYGGFHELGHCKQHTDQSVIASGTEEAVELRACSVYAVEKMREMINKKWGKQKQVLSAEPDLWPWSCGVQCPSLQHHRTLTLYY